MAFAPDYEPTTDFSQDEANVISGRSTVRTNRIDAEFSNISVTINAINNNLQGIQRSDNKLKDKIVEKHALSDELMMALGSTPEAIALINQAVADAQDSRSAAQTSETNAANSASAASTSATNANNSANAASTSATNAATSATTAGNAQTAAELARDAANATGRIYATTSAGIAATTNGQYFSVIGQTSDNFLDLYLNSSGSAVYQKTYPTKDFITNRLPESAPLDMAWSVVDSSDKAAIGVSNDGTFLAKNATINTLNSDTITAATSTIGVLNSSDIRTTTSSIVDGSTILDMAWSVIDSSNKAAIGVSNDGTFLAKNATVANLVIDTINGQAYSPQTTNSLNASRYGGVYPFQISYISCFGQSLAEGSNGNTAGNLTTAQEYDNIGFVGRANSPTQTYPLTVANTQVGTRGESPLYGTLGNIKELILKENGLTYSQNDFQLLGCCNGWSGYPIDSLKKNTTPYNYMISQASAGSGIASAQTKTFGCLAVTYMQGEANEAMSPSIYMDKLKQLAIDLNTDIKSATGQKQDVVLVTYQTSTGTDQGFGARAIALAQLQAANESQLIFMACPMYQFDYYDYQHINATSAKWVGGYLGLAIKRIVVDKMDWQPLKPISHIQSGNIIDLIFNKDGLVLDTTLIPAQTNYGFQVLDTGGNQVTINSITVISPNRVRFNLASTPSAGYVIRYGFANAIGKSPYVGGCGNLRDSQGDTIVYSAVNKPLHNWCVIFSYTV